MSVWEWVMTVKRMLWVLCECWLSFDLRILNQLFKLCMNEFVIFHSRLHSFCVHCSFVVDVQSKNNFTVSLSSSETRVGKAGD